jgi:zinc protease
MRHRVPAALTAAAVLSIPSMPAQAQNPPPERRDLLPFKATERTLANGLKVIVVPTGFPNLVSVQIPVQTGSRNEVEPGKSGFAHFFEHMMFRGTPNYPPEKYQAIMTRSGARTNAYTTDDFTNYHATFAKEDLGTILEIEADRFKNLSYPEEAFKTEARAVLGEYNKNSANPLNKLIEVQRDHAFAAHPYKHTTMGFIRDIEDMPNQFQYAQEFFRRWYRPEYTTVIVAGDVTPETVLPLVEKHWGDWKPGTYKVDIPQEPLPRGPVYAHVPWPTGTLPWVAVAFHSPAFSETGKEYAALDLLMDLTFGPTSDLYKRLVEDEQKVDQLFPYYPGTADPQLTTVAARVKDMKDALDVRNQILEAFAQSRDRAITASRLADAKSNARYGFVRTLDNTESIAAALARFVRYRRAYGTLNQLFTVYEAVTPEDLQAVARKYFTDAGLVVTTLSKDAMPEAMAAQPALATLTSAAGGAVAASKETTAEPVAAQPPRATSAPASGAAAAGSVKTLAEPSALPQINVKLLFTVGSAHDPAGKEGLAALSASMIAEAGSRAMRIDEIKKALFPLAGSFDAQVDKEMTTFTGRIHSDNWGRFLEIALPMLLEPGLREDDFRRVKDAQMNALKQDLRNNNEEELGKERLQGNLFAGTPYGHPVLGTVAGIEAVTLDDVKAFIKDRYTRANLTLGLAGDAPAEMRARLNDSLAGLPEGAASPAPQGVAGRSPKGIEVDIIEKDTRATAISFGHPIAVTRSHPDFAALWLARAWLGEHRASVGHLYERIREVRGMNYGDYAYIEAFPRGMFQFFADPNLGRRAQIFEVWIRPVVPENAHMALRIAVHELRKLIDEGLTPEQFETTRNYLMKNVFLITSTQDRQLGYALDSQWYGIGEFTKTMRDQLSKLTVADVNRAVKKHLSGRDLSVVMITKDAKGLRDRLTSDAPSTITYDAPKPPELLEEDKVIGVLKLQPTSVTITPVEQVFAR